MPKHKELATGTLKSAIRQAGVSVEEFVSAHKKQAVTSIDADDLQSTLLGQLAQPEKASLCRGSGSVPALPDGCS